MRFAGKLVLLTLAVILVIIIAVVYFSYDSSTKILESEIKSNLENYTFNTIAAVDRSMFDRYSDIKVIATGPLFSSRSTSPKQITERMLQYRNIYKYYISLSFFDLNGVRIV